MSDAQARQVSGGDFVLSFSVLDHRREQNRMRAVGHPLAVSPKSKLLATS
jgi:hypothetical protein